MAESPSAEDISLWQRRLAAQANNRAWRLAESTSRTAEEDEDMLQGAHAAMFFWKIVGNAGNRAHAALLLAHVYALLQLPHPAKHYLAQAEPFFLGQKCEPWETAIALMVKSNVAAAAGEADIHARCYAEAAQLVAALPDPEDREILNATLRVIPKPERADGTPA